MIMGDMKAIKKKKKEKDMVNIIIQLEIYMKVNLKII